jgi:hypothetical protein
MMEAVFTAESLYQLIIRHDITTHTKSHRQYFEVYSEFTCSTSINVEEIPCSAILKLLKINNIFTQMVKQLKENDCLCVLH